MFVISRAAQRLGVLTLLLTVHTTRAGVSGYTEQYDSFADGDASHYIDEYDNYSEQECADECTYDLSCFSFEWRDPAGANGATGNCKTSYFNELDGPGLTDSDAEEWNFYEADSVECPDYPTLDGATISTTGTGKGDKTIVACDEGYFGGGTSYCLGTGEYDQTYACYGTTSDVVLSGTDCTWRAETDDAPGTFEQGNIDSLPTYWVEEYWNHGYCWNGSTTLIASLATSKDNCKTLCDADGTCSGAEFDGTTCSYYSGDAVLATCADGHFGYQKLSLDMIAVSSTSFAHCGDASLVLQTDTVTIASEWVLVGCFDQYSSFTTGDSETPTADAATNIFEAAEAASPPYKYVAFAYVNGDESELESDVVLFSELWVSAADSTTCLVPCITNASYFCGDQTQINDEGNGGWAVYVFQPQGTAISVVEDNVTDPATFNLFAGQSYLAHFWAMVQQVNLTKYPANSVVVESRVADADETYASTDSNPMGTAFEWVSVWHDIFVPSVDVDFAGITIGSTQLSDYSALYIDDVIVYCVSCCYPQPDFFLPNRMYYEDDTKTLGKLDSDSGFWDEDVSNEYTTAIADTYVSQVCASATGADASVTSRFGLALSYRPEDHPIIGGNYVLELGPEGVARAYNFEAEPSCGCYVINSGQNAAGGYYRTGHSLVGAPTGIWTYSVYIRVSEDWDGSLSAFQAQWTDADGGTIKTTSTGAWVKVDNNPVYGEFVYASKIVNLKTQPVYLELYIGGPGYNSAGTIETFSIEVFDPEGNDWLEGTGRSECGNDFPGFIDIDGNAAIVNVTCEEFMSPFWTEHKLEGIDNTIDVVLYERGDRGCVKYVLANTWTQTTDFDGNSWDFYNSCDDFCGNAGSSCTAARYEETQDPIECALGPLPDVIECQCSDPLIVYSVTTDDGYDTSLNVGTTDDQIVTGGGNIDFSYDVANDEECMVLCRDDEDCQMFEFYSPRSCMLYQSDFSVLTDTCYGRYDWSDRTTGGCSNAAYSTFDTDNPPNDAAFDDLQTKIDDEGYTDDSRADLDELCKQLCEDALFGCLAYAVADDTLFATSAYVCALYDSCGAADTGVSLEHYVREYDMNFLNIGDGLQCSTADGEFVPGGIDVDECAFLCLLDANCETFSWAEDGWCIYSNTAAQCTVETNSSSALYMLTECAFFGKSETREWDVFHAIVPSYSEFFGAVAPFNFDSTMTNVYTRTAWETCDPGSLVSLADAIDEVTDYCDGDWSTDLASGAVTEVALCYDAAVTDSGDASTIEMVIYGDSGECFYTTDASSVGADAACTWVMETADILTVAQGIEHAPSSSTITTLWDGTCFEQGASSALHSTCVGPAGCLSGWEGIFCDEDIDDCASFPCEDHLECFDLGTNLFECRCVGGWGAMCTQPLAISNRQSVSHAKYCWVATDAVCSVYEEDYTYTGDITSLDVCKNYCTVSEWCTHLAWDVSTNECRMFDSTVDGCAAQTFATDKVIFSPCADTSGDRDTKGYRYLEIGSRGAKIKNSFDRTGFETINLL